MPELGVNPLDGLNVIQKLQSFTMSIFDIQHSKKKTKKVANAGIEPTTFA